MAALQNETIKEGQKQMQIQTQMLVQIQNKSNYTTAIPSVGKMLLYKYKSNQATTYTNDNTNTKKIKHKYIKRSKSRQIYELSTNPSGGKVLHNLELPTHILPL